MMLFFVCFFSVFFGFWNHFRLNILSPSRKEFTGSLIHPTPTPTPQMKLTFKHLIEIFLDFMDPPPQIGLNLLKSFIFFKTAFPGGSATTRWKLVVFSFQSTRTSRRTWKTVTVYLQRSSKRFAGKPFQNQCPLEIVYFLLFWFLCGFRLKIINAGAEIFGRLVFLTDFWRLKDICFIWVCP